MTGKRTRFTPDEKVRIVLQTFNLETGVAELCRQHNLAPRTIYAWKERFLEGGRISLEGADAGRRERRHGREVSDLKRIIGEYAVANAALKKRWRGAGNERGGDGARRGRAQQVPPAVRGVQEGVVLQAEAEGRAPGSRGTGRGTADCS